MTLSLKYKPDLYQILWLITGVLITMPVLTLPVGGLALFNIPFILAILIQVFHKKGRIYSYKLPLYLFIFIILVSSIMSITMVPDDWYAATLRSALKLSVVFAIMVFVFSDQELNKCREFFMKGLIWAVPIQFVWIIIQALSWSLLNIRLNALIFGVSVYNEGMHGITLTGLSWERADTAFLFAVSTAYTKNPYIRTMALIGTIMTTSRSGLILIAIIYGYEILTNVRRLHINKLKSKTVLLAVSFVSVFIVLLIVVQYVHISLVDDFILKLNQLISRFEGFISGINDYGAKQIDPHQLYYIWLPNTLKQSSLHQLIIGSGTRISGWMYTQIYNRFPNIGPWNVECDFIALILGNGILGLLIYYAMLLKSFLDTKSEAQRKIIILFLAGSFFYQFVSSTLGLLLIVFAFNNAKEKVSPDIKTYDIAKR